MYRFGTTFPVIAVSILSAAVADGAAVGFTSRSDFATAVASLNGATAVVDFDGLTAGSAIASGAPVQGLTFLYDFGDVQIVVQQVTDPATVDTTSPPNYAGSSDAGFLQDGDDFDLTFDTPVNAIGITITTADDMSADDVVLTAGGGEIGLDAAAVQSTLADGANEYFVGIVDDSNSFATAALRTAGGGFFLYAIDDLMTATAPDADGDGVADTVDNCLLAENAGQSDTDADNIGNACDADIAQPNDCIVNVLDLGVLRLAFFSTPDAPNWNPDGDFTADEQINVEDLGIMKAHFFAVPGPSALPNPCGGSTSVTKWR